MLIGVTVITSMDQWTLNHDLRVEGTIATQVAHLARLCRAEGLDGIVTSSQEVHLIAEVCGPEFVTVIPGIRPSGTTFHDQRRVGTPTEAIQAGAHYLVLGRAITQADDPVAAADAIVAEVAAAAVPPEGIGNDL
jgi:orotidine-5'-phosphate decarboxylase